MIFNHTSLQDAVLVELEPLKDDRGYFARAMSASEFAENGLVSEFVQANLSRNTIKGTLRGMHFQRAPHGEVKLVRCTRGAIYDVIIDLRPESPTFRRWEGFELTERNARTLYVPVGFAHGFLTLENDTDVFYHVSHPYTPEAEGGLRFDDPAIAINWPLDVQLVSKKDTSWALIEP